MGAVDIADHVAEGLKVYQGFDPPNGLFTPLLERGKSYRWQEGQRDV